LFSPPPSAMFRRPARDRNYEFWGDQTFYGENPPQAAVVSWMNKKQVGDVKLRITDSAGREVREISGQTLARSTGPGIQTACWDLRVQPNPAPPAADGRGGRAGRAGEAGQAGEAGGAGRGNQEQSPFGPGCPVQNVGGGGGFGGGANTAGPY